MTDKDAFGPDRPLRIGTRGSPLALAQAHEVRERLGATHGLPEEAFAVTVIQTTGDAVLDRPLSEIGGKGLFTKELDLALEDRRIDIAVHSMKDVPTMLPDGMEIVAVLPREDVRDALVGPGLTSLSDLPEGAVFGTSSLRRRAQLLARRPDLRMVEFRGNVQTRLKKLDDGVAVATLLARAGLNRLGHGELGTTVEVNDLLPAIAQGAIGIQTRSGDAAAAFVAPIHDAPTATRIAVERAFLRVLDGSCRTPIAGLAVLEGDGVHFRGEVLSPDGARVLKASRTGNTGDAVAMGEDAAAEVLAAGAKDLF